MGYRLTGAVAAIAALLVLPAAVRAQDRAPARIAGKPNLNGIWQAMNTAYWDLEAHGAEALKDFWRLGAFAARPAGQSVVEGGRIPYLPDALKKRDENRAGWPASDPATKCYLPGIPRANYMPFPFQIVQGGHDLLFVYEFASANRPVYMSDWIAPPVDTWMGRSNGHWDGDTLVIETTGFNGRTWMDRAGNFYSSSAKVTERISKIDDGHLQYQATIDDPNSFSRPWTLSMPLYRRLEPNAELLEYRCVPFVDELLYKDLEQGRPDRQDP